MTLLNDFTKETVDPIHQKGSIWIGFTSAAWIVAVTTMFTGGTIAMGLSLSSSIVSILLGMTCIGVVGALMGRLGSKYRVSTTMLARYSFGESGAKMLGVILAVTLGVGWFAWQISFFSLTLHEILPGYFFTEITISKIWAGALMTITAIGGFKWLSRLSFVSVPLILTICTYGAIVASTQFHNELVVSKEGSLTIFSAITVVIGSVIFGAVVLPDISRYGSKPSKSGFIVGVGYGIGGLLTMSAGAYMVSSVEIEAVGQVANIPAVLASLGLGSWAFVALLLAQWTTNDSNLYSGSLGLSVALNIKKEFLVLIMGSIGILLSVFSIQDHFVMFLVFLGTFIPPVAGVMVIDYFVREPEDTIFSHIKSSFENINILPILIVIGSGVSAYYLSNLGGIFDASAILSLLMAGLLQYLFLKFKYS